MNILAVCAHPDDEVIGLGATLAKHSSKGDRVHILIVSEGVSAQYEDKEKFLKLRRDACLKSAKLLGIENVVFGNHPDARLNQVPLGDLAKTIGDEIEKIKPDRVYTHFYGDLHLDHRAVSEATIVATRRDVNEVYFYEVVGNVHRGSNQRFVPNVYVDVSNGFIDKKLEALRCYETEIKDFPHPLSEESLLSLSKVRGVESGLKNAEAFMCALKKE